MAPAAEFVLSGGTQVFAPAAADIVCFEPMTAPTNALSTGDRPTLLEPGGRYTATFSITIEPRRRPGGAARRATEYDRAA